MEFLRFGSSIPGGYWGCCAVCIIQNFKVDPDYKASIQLVSGDSGTPVMKGSDFLFVGPTYRDIFKERIRIGTFSSTDMPNHAFFAVLTESQIAGGVGRKWLEILKEEGFEFIRTTDNSVYTGHQLTGQSSPHPNYIFGLFRNISGSRIKDPFTPPKAWTDLNRVVPEAWEAMSPSDRLVMAEQQTAVHTQMWKDHGATKFMTEAELVEAGAPVIYAGLRSKYPPQSKDAREKLIAAEKAVKPATASAFPATVAVSTAA